MSPHSTSVIDRGGPALRLWTPGHESLPVIDSPDPPREQSAAHRTIHPVRAPGLVTSTAQQAALTQLADDHKSGPRHVPPEDFLRVRETQTLSEFYTEWMEPWRIQLKEKKQVANGTLAKDRQALRRFERFDLTQRPPTWPQLTPWKGCPLGYLAGGYLDRFFEWLAEEKKDDGSPLYAYDTIRSTRTHLMGVVNFAKEIGAIEQGLELTPLSALSCEDLDDLDEDLSTIWTPHEQMRIFEALDGHPDMQAAFVLSLAIGARTVDLFQLRWSRNVRLDDSGAMVKFRAIKTGKTHGIPLHPTVLQHLLRLPGADPDSRDLLFPRLSVALEENKDPERSHAARRRNRLIKTRMKAAGVPDYNKPWQVNRATCCTELNNVTKGIGDWVIGQGGGRATTQLAADYYDNPSEQVRQTVMARPMPAVFRI